MYLSCVTKELDMTEDPLDAVFDQKEELEGLLRERLAKMIIPFAVVDPENGIFYPKRAWNELNSKRKVLVFLLARLALSTRNPEFSKTVMAKDVEDATELPGGTVRPKLSELLKDRVAFRESDGGYYVRSTTMSLNNAWAIMEDVLEEE